MSEDRIRLRRNPPNVSTPQGYEDLYVDSSGTFIRETAGGVKAAVGASEALAAATSAANIQAALAADPAAARDAAEAASSAQGFLTDATLGDTSGVIPFVLPFGLSPYTDASADTAITAAGVTDERAKNHYQRVVQLIKGMGLWASLDNAYLLGTKHQSSSTTLKSLTGASDATGTSTFTDYAATFNGSSNKYLFTNLNAGTAVTGKTFVGIHRLTGTYTQRSLVSNFAAVGSQGMCIFVSGSPVAGTGPNTIGSIFGYGSINGTTNTEGHLPLGSDGKFSFAAVSLKDGVLSTYGNNRTPIRAALATAWNNNTNNGIGANPNSSYFYEGEIAFAAVFNTGLTDAQMFALRAGLENILSDTLSMTGAVVWVGDSLTGSTSGGGTTWPAKLLGLTGWTTVTRSSNLAVSGALQTQKIEPEYFTKSRQWIPTAGQDNIHFQWSGINDILNNVLTATITSSIRRSILRARLDGFRVAVLTITPGAPTGSGTSFTLTAGQLTQIEDVNTWLRANCENLGAQLVDLDEIGVAYPAFLDPTDSTYFVAGDGLHHNDAGRALIAVKVAAEVTPPSVP